MKATIVVSSIVCSKTATGMASCDAVLEAG